MLLLFLLGLCIVTKFLSLSIEWLLFDVISILIQFVFSYDKFASLEVKCVYTNTYRWCAYVHRPNVSYIVYPDEIRTRNGCACRRVVRMYFKLRICAETDEHSIMGVKRCSVVVEGRALGGEGAYPHPLVGPENACWECASAPTLHAGHCLLSSNPYLQTVDYAGIRIQLSKHI